MKAKSCRPGAARAGAAQPPLSQRGLLLLFAAEGLLNQTAVAINGYANPLYATQLGASQGQIGLVSSVPPLAAFLTLLPVGLLSSRMPSSRTLPVSLAVFMGAAYGLYAAVPFLGGGALAFYFLFLALTTGLVSTYTAQWQALFADTTPQESRNEILTFRTRLCYLPSVTVPLLCGGILAALPAGRPRLAAYQALFVLCGALFLAQAFILRRIPVAPRPRADAAPMLREIPAALRTMAGSRAFRSFFFAILFFYATWYLDYGTWYLAETLYGGMSERHLGYFSALYSLSQFATLGLFARMNRRRGVQFTLLFGIAGLTLCPLAVFSAPLAPAGLRPWVFMAVGVVFNTAPCCIPICVLQMLLSVIPQERRALNISLYTMATCALQTVVPYLGNGLYRYWGADQAAMIRFYLFVMLMRCAAFALFFRRYRRARGGRA